MDSGASVRPVNAVVRIEVEHFVWNAVCASGFVVGVSFNDAMVGSVVVVADVADAAVCLSLGSWHSIYLLFNKP